MCAGITLAIFSTDGNTPDEKDARWVEMSFFNSFKILVGRLFGPVDLSLFSEDSIKFTSCASVGVLNNDSALMMKKILKWFIWKFDIGFSFFCNWTKIVIKDVSNM